MSEGSNEGVISAVVKTLLGHPAAGEPPLPWHRRFGWAALGAFVYMVIRTMRDVPNGVFYTTMLSLFAVVGITDPTGLHVFALWAGGSVVVIVLSAWIVAFNPASTPIRPFLGGVMLPALVMLISHLEIGG